MLFRKCEAAPSSPSSAQWQSLVCSGWKWLTADNPSKSFRGSPALRELNFNVGPGDIHCLLGANGAGKTTAHTRRVPARVSRMAWRFS